MAKPPKKFPHRDAAPKLVASLPAKQRTTTVPVAQSHATRETIEALVIAFVLAFLIRTFEVEAFVIPTGSMAPTLMGRHKDVDCPQCGHRYQITASEEENDVVQRRLAEIQGWTQQLRQLEAGRPRNELEIMRAKQEIANRQHQIAMQDVVGGVCPVCRYVMPVTPNLPRDVSTLMARNEIPTESSYNGDRIIVNKYLYALTDPERWDIVVFKFPGNAQMNYIKRLVGLPGETVRVYQGDLFVAEGESPDDADFTIAAKPADKVLAMRQLVHDTDYDPADLFEAGWPLRWQSESSAPGWETETEVDGRDVRQLFVVHPAGDTTAWLRYRHIVPDYDVWQAVEQRQDGAELPPAVPQLITDFNAYNARVSRAWATEAGRVSADPSKLGMHWVGDLMVEADVEVKQAGGELDIDLVKGGKHFACRIDLADGKATLHIDDLPDFAPSAETSLSKPGSYRVAFANVDDQLLVWVDGSLLTFDADTHYDADRVYGDRRSIRPQTSDADPGDLAPAGIGARGADLEITHLELWRDIYYIADSWQRNHGQMVTDFDNPNSEMLSRIATDPDLWYEFERRRHHDFPLAEDQYFVMGDNSPESLDARLWRGQNPNDRGQPGGAYLERDLLIGKALFVYWPHSWNRIPGTPIPFPLFPNFEDMRLVE